MKPDLERAKRFLKAIRPRGPWTLTAIHPDRVPLTAEQAAQKGVLLDKLVQSMPTNTFAPGFQFFLDQFLERWNTTHGIYFTANPVRNQAYRRRCSEFMRKDEFLLDVLAFQYIAADFDPPADQTPDQWEKFVTKKLQSDKKLRPSLLWRSGNGMQCAWRIKPAVLLDDDNDAVRECKLVGKGVLDAIDKRLGIISDKVASLDHIFRLPGSINWPNKAKRDKGRVPILAGDFTSNRVSYSIGDLPKAKAKDKPTIFGLNEPPAGWDAEANITWAVLHLENTTDLSSENVSGAAWRTSLVLRDWGISPDKTFDLMCEHWVPRCDWDWDEDELRDKITRAYATAQNDPGCKTEAYRDYQVSKALEEFKDAP